MVTRCVQCKECFFSLSVMKKLEDHMIRGLLRDGIRGPMGFVWLRKRVGLRIDSLAELLQVTPETIRKWEKRKRVIPSIYLAIVHVLASERRKGVSTTADGLRKHARLAKSLRAK
jgi:hypothetical protein